MSESLNHSIEWFVQKPIHSGIKHCSAALRRTNVPLWLCLDLYSLVKQKEKRNRQYCLKWNSLDINSRWQQEWVLMSDSISIWSLVQTIFFKTADSFRKESSNCLYDHWIIDRSETDSFWQQCCSVTCKCSATALFGSIFVGEIEEKKNRQYFFWSVTLSMLTCLLNCCIKSMQHLQSCYRADIQENSSLACVII